MHFKIFLVTISIIVFSDFVNSYPQVDLSGKSPLENATQTVQNATMSLQDAFQSGANLPTNLQGALQNGADLPNLTQVLGNTTGAQNPPPNAQNLPTLNQITPSLPSPGVLGQAAQAVGRIPSSIGETGRNLVQNVPNLAQNFPSFPSTLSPSFNPSNLSSLFPNFQFSNQLPQLSSFSQNFPFNSSNIPNFISSFGQNNSAQLPSLGNYPNWTSAFNQNSPGSLPSNMSFDLSEENGSEVTDQRIGTQGINQAKSIPGQQLKPGGILSNLHQFTHNQIQTTRDALKDTTRNLLNLKNQERGVLRQGLLGNGGFAGGLGGLLSGNPSQPNSEQVPSGTSGNILGSGLFGNSPAGGLLGIGRR